MIKLLLFKIFSISLGVLLLVLPDSAYSQKLEPMFVNRIGSVMQDRVLSFISDSSGGYYTAAQFEGTTIHSVGSLFILLDSTLSNIIKFNPNNTIDQVTNIGKAYGCRMAIDKENTLFAFSTYSNDSVYQNTLSKVVTIFDTTINLHWSAPRVSMLYRLHPNGSKAWGQPIYSNGLRNGPYVYNIHVSNNKNVFIYGSFRDSMMINDSLVIGNAGFFSTFIATFDSSGSLKWFRATGPNEHVDPSVMQVNANEEIYITGSYNSSVTFVNNALTDTTDDTQLFNTNYFLAKFDNQGTLTFLKRIQTSQSGYYFHYTPMFILGEDQNLYFYTEFTSDSTLSGSGNFTIFDTTLYSYGMYDCLVVKVSPAGDRRKVLQFGGNGADFMYQFGNADGENLFIVAELSDSTKIHDAFYSSGRYSNSPDTTHAFMLRINHELEFNSLITVSQRVMSSPGYFLRLVGNEYISCYDIRESLTLTGITYPNIGDTLKNDIVIIRSEANFIPLQTYSETVLQNQSQIFPNPSTNYIRVTFTLPTPSHTTITLHDILGREVIRREMGVQTEGEHEESIDVSGLPAGSYMVKISTNRETFTSRISVVR